MTILSSCSRKTDMKTKDFLEKCKCCNGEKLFTQISSGSNQTTCVVCLFWLARYLFCTKCTVKKWASFTIQGATARATRSDTSAAQHCRYVNATIAVIYSEVRTEGGGVRGWGGVVCTNPNRSLEALRHPGLTPSRILTCGIWLCKREEASMNVRNKLNKHLKQKNKHTYFTIRSSGMLTSNYFRIV